MVVHHSLNNQHINTSMSLDFSIHKELKHCTVYIPAEDDDEEDYCVEISYHTVFHNGVYQGIEFYEFGNILDADMKVIEDFDDPEIYKKAKNIFNNTKRYIDE